MATPREQHSARGGRARVVGSGHQDGRQPMIESPATASSDAFQRGLDAASSEPRSLSQAELPSAPQDAQPAALEREDADAPSRAPDSRDTSSQR